MYLFIVLWFGPWLMTFRKCAFDLRNFMIIYNTLLVLLNAYIAQILIKSAWALNYDILCQRISYSNDPLEIQIASGLWCYYVSKLIEFTDTIIFVLRKKKSQMTFLHVYHHITMPFWCWIAVRWYAGGSTFFIPAMNSVIHCIMYTYYGASALGIRFVQKRWLTALQLVQFFTGIIFGISLLYNSCIFIPRPLIYLGLVYGITIILLFINFYREVYTNKVQKDRTA
ncbi:unnamed protein product [Hymenolepis diminuta]|uniref:Elongation of very long chain fatty acids protein n=2 Tax=Hymenolepis diminuta TaxID=6216 RepID=A0A3P6ZNB8_HYMDI|nr:unnamed protein product [Hymenolepis diminuta]